MLREGVVNISAKEEKAIDNFVRDLERFDAERSSLNKEKSNNAICAALKEYANTVLAPKYGLDRVFWRFVYEPKYSSKAGYAPTHDDVFINLAHHVPIIDGGLQNQKIDWNKIAESIVHEWVHIKQDDIIKKTHPKGMATSAFQKMYKKTAYSDIKWEQMALARQELEWIKRNVKQISPQHILRWLKVMGITSDRNMVNLKQTNPQAYKRILKYAVMFALKQMARSHTRQQ